MKSHRILISGAGIAGLAIARCFQQLGIEHVIIEKNNQSNPSSSGIALPFNALQALRKMGLAEEILESAHQVNEIIYAKKNGRIISRASLLKAPLNQDKFVAMRRSKLHQILLDGIESHINFGTTIQSAHSNDKGVDVTCSNATLSGQYDAVVSAEGIHSTLRDQCFPNESTLLDHNISNWRFVINHPNHGLQPTYMLAQTELFLTYPIDANSLYCYAHVYDDTEKFKNGSPQEHLRNLFGDFGGKVSNILDRLGDQPVICSRLRSVRKPCYAKDRIVFVGDAGSACSPLLQQGAASAFEDALCFAEQCHKHDMDKAIFEYQKIRAPRVEWVVKTSDDPIKKMKMMDNPVGASIRNMMIRRKGPLNV
ncbi:MAG: FAD-dependent monooxygenase, partial [Pseudomonadales bacterium]|nr:FAD-dependent monooxygenase [Pseudomonadales bacterium]